MNRFHRAACIVAALGAFAIPAAAQTAAAVAPALVKPGLWENTAVIESAGSNASRRIVTRSCFSADDAGRPEKLVPVQHEFGTQCTNRDVKAQGQNVTWQVSCSGKNGNSSGTGKLVFSAEGYVGTATLELAKPGAKAAKVTQQFSAKRIDNCK